MTQQSPIDKQSPLEEQPPLDENWLAISQDWQDLPYEKTDVDALVKKTKRRTWWAKFVMGLNIIATVGILIALLVGFYRGDWQTPTLVYTGFVFIASVVFIYYEVKIRLAAWQLTDAGPDDALKAAISGCQSSLHYARLVKWSFYLLTVPVNWYVYAMMEFKAKITWKTFVITNVILLVMYLINQRYQKKRQRELSLLEQVSDYN